MDSTALADAGTLQPDFTLMMADNGLDYKETETATANIFVFAPGAIEHVEDPVDLAPVEAAPSVGNNEVGKAAVSFEGNGDIGGVVGIKDGIFDKITQGRLQSFRLAEDLQPLLNVESHDSGAGQRILAGAKVAAQQGREVDRGELETGAALFEAVRGKEVVDKTAETFGIAKHGIDEDFKFFRRRTAQTYCFQMKS